MGKKFLFHGFVFFAAVFFLIPSSARAGKAAGILDKTFGENGKIVTSLPARGKVVARLPDKELAVFTYEKILDSGFQYTIYNEKNEPTFGPHTVKVTPFPQKTEAVGIEKVIVTDQGYLVVFAFGFTRHYPGKGDLEHSCHGVRILRLNGQGEWDPTFGKNGSGILLSENLGETFVSAAFTSQESLILATHSEKGPDSREISTIRSWDNKAAPLRVGIDIENSFTPNTLKGKTSNFPNHFMVSSVVALEAGNVALFGNRYDGGISTPEIWITDLSGKNKKLLFGRRDLEGALGNFRAAGASVAVRTEKGSFYFAGFLSNTKNLRERGIYVAKLDLQYKLDPNFGTKGVVVLPAMGEDFPYSHSVDQIWASDKTGVVTVSDTRSLEKDLNAKRRLVVKRWSTEKGEPIASFGDDGLLVPAAAVLGQYSSMTLDGEGRVVIAGSPPLEPGDPSPLQLLRYIN